jgi:hypothetical protein
MTLLIEHLISMRAFFERVSQANLTSINLKKSYICHAEVRYLGHRVGFGQIRPVDAHIKAIIDYRIHVPSDKKTFDEISWSRWFS